MTENSARKTMKILFLHDESWDSGIAHYALTLALEMKNRGHGVEFWCRADSFAAKECRRLSLDFLELKNPWLHWIELRREVKKRKFEIINAHTGATQSLGLAIKGALPLIRTRAEARPASHHVFSHLASQKTALLIAANTKIEAEIKSVFPAARVEMVFQGIPGAPSYFFQHFSPHGAIGLLGRLDSVKGHEIFIEAAAILKPSYPDLKFLAAGDAQPGRRQSLQRKIEALGLKNNVKLLGRVEDIWDFISQCQIGVVASTASEAVSRAALEWMSAGRPVVASRVGGLPDLIAHEKNGLLVAPQNARELAVALERLIRNPDLTQEMGIQSRKRFEHLFSLKSFGDKTEKIFLDIIKDNEAAIKGEIKNHDRA